MEQVFYIDLSEVLTIEDFQEALARELPLPEYYGMNLDAFNDVLIEFGSEWNLIFYNTSRAEMSLGKYFTAFQRLCSEACEEFPTMKIRFFA